MKIRNLWALLTFSVGVLVTSNAFGDLHDLRINPPQGLQRITVASNETSTDKVTVSLSSQFDSNRITDNGVAYGDGVWVSQLALHLPWDIDVGGVLYRGLNQEDPYSDEEQLYIQKVIDFCEKYYFLVGYRYEFIGGGDVPEWDLGIPYAELGIEFHPTPDITIVPFARAEYWYNTTGQTEDNGAILKIGAKFLARINPRLTVSVKGELVHDDGLQGGNSGFVGRLEGYVNFQATQQTTIFVGGEATNPWTDGPVDNRGVERRATIGVEVGDFVQQIRNASSWVKGQGN